MKLMFVLNPEQVSDEEVLSYKYRGASRAVVLDADGKVGLMHAKNDGYHKLPGGGIDEGENPREALLRECREELGCDIAIENELGNCLEYRKSQSLKQESFCFIARVVGEKGRPELTESELADGFEPVWVSMEKAIQLVHEGLDKHDKYRFLQNRDEKILLAAMKM